MTFIFNGNLAIGSNLSFCESKNSVNYQKLLPDEYFVSFNNINKNFYLQFSNNYSEDWKLVITRVGESNNINQEQQKCEIKINNTTFDNPESIKFKYLYKDYFEINPIKNINNMLSYYIDLQSLFSLENNQEISFYANIYYTKKSNMIVFYIFSLLVFLIVLVFIYKKK